MVTNTEQIEATQLKRNPNREEYFRDSLLEDIQRLPPEVVASKWSKRMARAEARMYEDPLTGLKTRETGKSMLGYALANARRTKTPLSVIMLDLDKFKQINDTRGHDAGNSALKTVANTIRDNCRDSDIPCRYAGDEFYIILPVTDTEGAIKIADKIREAVPQAMKLKDFDVTTSIGITSLRPKPVENGNPDEKRLYENFNVKTLLFEADIALLAAKKRGKDRVEVYTPQG